MKIQKNIWVFVMVGLFVSSQLVYADQCDDIVDKAHGIFDSAKKAANQKNYNRAAELYENAAKYYDKVANMRNCRCPKIYRTSKNNAKISGENADKHRKWMKEYATEVGIIEEYNQAKEKYNEGNTYARNREWDKAIAAFEEAAQIWESVGAATQSENGKRALKGAKQARKAANLARKYQQKQ
jgi:tetratricopeptide (TPR) repeat protein